ncbi:outer membrane protein assembly factor BamA [Sphingosinicella sp. GR2756]|uniref:Outer membrane protein assembly factor BamA n=1 Tax=Sphingosinicella rhizophila TaxID=3050082 RepID=A0ABU3Q2P9_9SPHN|nr:outer membrane protein assembly factor BamA [Sphingosinicella sp. GR2756]MDT9597684.1 outer membrane protein assembly factor BamA [Sphingosinicella sp. GR2756]
MKAFSKRRRLCAVLLTGTVLGGYAVPAVAQDQPAQEAPAAPSPVPVETPAPPVQQPWSGTVLSLNVAGNQRLEPETVISYMKLRVGEPYTKEQLDEALRDLYATELFADVQILGGDTGNLIIQVRENPVINRIVLEGNKRIKDDKINPEIRLAPRQIFTRTKARADVARIIELYRRQGRFAASVEPKIVQLDQNRVDVVFEISEGPKSKIRQINIIGNEEFSDGELRGEMVTKRTGLLSFLGSGNIYDPDRLAFDQQKLRQFYLTEGYADFRVVSAVAELTPDRRDFIITYVVEEGDRYKFADVKVESAIRDFRSEDLNRLLPMKSGDWYNAKQIEDTVTLLNESAGLFGYAFADVQPNFDRDKENKTMSVTFQVAETPRVYVERIDINGNTSTRDKVIRREFRLAEGDPFNSVRVKRSRDRIQSLGFFQDNLEIEQTQGSAADRVILAVDVEEKATGELQLSAGFSSLERFLINLSIAQRNFMGKGQTLRAGVNYSSYSKSIELGFTDPYVFDRNIAVGADIYRRDYNSFNYINGDERNTTYQQVTTGGQIRMGVPLTEYLSLQGRYSLNLEEVSLNRNTFFSDPEGDGIFTCDPLLAGRYLCDALGERLNSSIGYSLAFSTLNNSLRPTAGERLTLSQDFAGLGGDVHYLRTRINGAKYWGLGGGFVFSASAEAGYIHSFDDSTGPGVDPVRLIDRFFLGEPQMRGFDIRGVGPRIQRIPYNDDGTLVTDRKNITDDALGGRAYYLGRIELEIPLSAGIREFGLRPSAFIDVGAVFGVKNPVLQDLKPGDPGLFRPALNSDGLRLCTTGGETPVNTPIPAGASCPAGQSILTQAITGPFKEVFLGDTPKPRVSIGFGINWNSPFGPFRIDIAKALIKAEGDDTKLLTFNVGTAF